MTKGYKLYGRQGSGSFAVQVALEDLGAPYERIWVGSEPGEVAEFRKLNPTGKVPALGLPDGGFMFESGAMLIHLALAHPEAGFAPRAGSTAHARFLQWIVFLSANVYETVLRVYYSDRYGTHGAADADSIRERATAELGDQLELISRSLDPFVLGADYSFADPYLYMLARWYPGERAALHSRLPRLGAHAERVAARASVARTAADHGE